MKRRNLTGIRVGKLVAVKDVGCSNDGHRLWLCQCDCGNTTICQSNNLVCKTTNSCGCLIIDHCKSDKMREIVHNTMYGVPKSSNHKDKLSKILKGRSVSEPYRTILVNRMKSQCGENNPNWKGGKSFEPYCKKFNENIKENIRNKFKRKCFICGKTEDFKKLDVHHIDYNKGQGCGYSWSLIPLCHTCHTRTTNSRHYYFNLLNNYWCYKYMESDIYDRFFRMHSI